MCSISGDGELHGDISAREKISPCSEGTHEGTHWHRVSVGLVEIFIPSGLPQQLTQSSIVLIVW